MTSIVNSFSSLEGYYNGNFIYRGKWLQNMLYRNGDLVFYNGLFYVATQQNTNKEPTLSGSIWRLFDLFTQNQAKIIGENNTPETINVYSYTNSTPASFSSGFNNITFVSGAPAPPNPDIHFISSTTHIIKIVNSPIYANINLQTFGVLVYEDPANAPTNDPILRVDVDITQGISGPLTRRVSMTYEFDRIQNFTTDPVPPPLDNISLQFKHVFSPEDTVLQVIYNVPSGYTFQSVDFGGDGGLQIEEYQTPLV